MTGPDDVPEEYQGPGLAKSAAFDLLVRCVQDCIDAGRFRPEHTDAFRLALGFWARVHGLTSLRIAKPQIEWPDDPGFVDDYTDVCLRGVARDEDR